MPHPRLVALDVETTGFGPADRIVEIAIATLDPDTLRTVEEYDTLVNPLRDIPGPASDIHGLTASDLEAAPTFREIAPAVGARVDGAVLIAHNARFDARMLDREFRRAGVPFDAGTPLCTCDATGRMSLTDACASFGIEARDHHRALSDVRATAALYAAVARRGDAPGPEHGVPARCVAEGRDVVIRTLRREALGGTPVPRVTRSPWREPRLAYRYAVNAALDTGSIAASEWSALDGLADTLGLTRAERDAQHLTLYRRALDAAGRDGRVSRRESLYLRALAETLSLADADAPATTPPDIEDGPAPGARVCFTGSGGAMRPRDEMEMIARRVGHVPVSNVTRKLDLLVAADPASHSGKTVKARGYGVRVMDAGRYLAHAYAALDR